MLRKISPEVEQLNTFIDRCEAFLRLVPKMERSKTINFNVVAETANDHEFNCWYGLFRKEYEDAPAFNYEQIAEYIGANTQDAEYMFGPASTATLHERVRHMDAIVFQHERKRGLLCF